MSEYVSQRFKFATRNHKMIIEHDDDVHRCIQFKSPHTFAYQFRLVTWPGHLAISGDCDDFIFTRLRDMFDFFRFAGPEYDSSDGPNYGYWSEKVQSVSKTGGLLTFSDDLYRDAIRRELANHVSGLTLSEAKECVEFAREEYLFDSDGDARESIQKVMNWHCPVTHKYPFNEFYECQVEDYSFGFKFACHAVQWGIKQYDLKMQGRDQASHDALVLKGAA